MRKFNAIKNAINFGKGTSMAQKRRTKRLQNETIQVNDKVQWTAWIGDKEVIAKGVVESIGEFNGKKTFTVTLFGTFPEDRGQTMISASRVSKIQERFSFMSDRLYEFIVTGTCVAAIVAGAIFGTWALLVTMSWQNYNE